MLGPAKPRRLDEPIAVSLEDLVPSSNFYRYLEAKFDLSFVREWVQELYAERGRPSIDPVVFCKLQLVMFFEGIRSERQLIETASLNLAHRWYLGYALDEPLPDHSSLTRIRQRLGIDVFQRFFEKVVDLCQEAGLVWGRELYFDATKVEANAGIPSLVPRFYYEATTHVADLFADEAYKKAIRKRQVWVEPLFAEAKEWHGLRRFRLRGLESANIQGLLIAAGQNLKRFLAATGWGRRPAPCGSLGALPREAWRIAVVSR
jgi:transposase